MARPIKDIDPDQVGKLAGIGCTLEEIAIVLDCNERTLRRRFVRAINEGRLNARTSLRRKQWQTAMGEPATTTTKTEKDGTRVVTITGGRAPSATMQIWLGKQMLGQKDKTELSGTDGGPIQTERLDDVPTDKLDAEITKLTAALTGLTQSLCDQTEAGDAAEGEGQTDG